MAVEIFAAIEIIGAVGLAWVLGWTNGHNSKDIP